ncbi:uncharacterized protein CEXT_774651 [Caerostris extrusa]|uniref:Uncharacterized protein n=1 Tax=Caerostris extrusa TaxID=172846 RepID=A0AAV4VLV1_CAEEX|nr:uncharacterized protein CEXT_774651 [Caerostris extrusa]
MKGYSPCKNYEAVEPVPGVAHVGALARDAHGNGLDAHLDGEEGENEVVEHLEQAAPARCAHLVGARLVHAQSDAVEQDAHHAHSLEPRGHQRVKDKFQHENIIVINKIKAKEYHDCKKNTIMML